MISFLISILIVYGIVLILTRGAIFNYPRTLVYKYVSKVENWFIPDDTECLYLLQNDSKYIDIKYKELYKKVNSTMDSFYSSSQKLDENKEKELTEMLKNLFEKIKQNIKENRNKNLLMKFYFLILDKFRTFIQCQMCMGFWIGLGLILMSYYFPIIIFNEKIIIASTFISMFLGACLFSGTTWAIDQIVEWFSENISK